jgi:hypothetical protein
LELLTIHFLPPLSILNSNGKWIYMCEWPLPHEFANGPTFRLSFPLCAAYRRVSSKRLDCTRLRSIIVILDATRRSLRTFGSTTWNLRSDWKGAVARGHFATEITLQFAATVPDTTLVSSLSHWPRWLQIM